MCTPTLAVATGMSQGALAFQTVSTLLSVSGLAMQAQASAQAGVAAQRAAAYQAAVAKRNQAVANQAAEDALARGKVSTAKQALRTKQLIARQRGAGAAGGRRVDIAGSSLQDLTADTAAAGKLDELTIRSNAEREALGFRTRGLNFAAEGELALLRGESAEIEARGRQTEALFGIGTTLISGARKIGFPKRKKG